MSAPAQGAATSPVLSARARHADVTARFTRAVRKPAEAIAPTLLTSSLSVPSGGAAMVCSIGERASVSGGEQQAVDNAGGGGNGGA